MRFQWLHGPNHSGPVTIHPFDGRISAAPEIAKTDANVRIAIALDVETTGLDRARDTIIEIGMRAFAFDRETGEVLGLTDAYDALRDPGAPISEEIRSLTGLTDADLAGQSIDTGRVVDMMARASLVIAHNAGFDRPFVDALLGATPRVAWGCSIDMIDWTRHGLPSTKLEALCALHGFYGTGHRAGADAASLVKLLSLRNAESGATYLRELLETARRPMVRVVAVGSPFDSKDALKTRGYRWDAGRRVWSTEIIADTADAERDWLASQVYGTPRNSATFAKIDPFTRFATGSAS